MVPVTRLNGKELYINPELIQTMEVTPNTVITFTNDEKLVVEETPETIIDRIMAFQARVRHKASTGKFED